MRVISLKYLLLASFVSAVLTSGLSSDEDDEVLFVNSPQNSGSNKRVRLTNSRVEATAGSTATAASSSSATAGSSSTATATVAAVLSPLAVPAATTITTTRKIKAAKNRSTKDKPPATKRPRKNSSEISLVALGSNKTSTSLKPSTPKPPKKAPIIEEATLRSELMNALLHSKTAITFNTKIANYKGEDVSQALSHDLLIASIHNGKESNTRNLLIKGFRLALGDNVISQTDSNAMIQAITANKIEFISLLLDTDPVGTIRLLDITIRRYPLHNVGNHFRNALEKNSDSVDTDAIQLAAETAANLSSLELFGGLFDSDLMTRMVPTSSLVTLFSFKPRDDQVGLFRTLLDRVNKDRKLTAPFELSLLSQAALTNSFNFLIAVEPHLSIFGWNVVIQALEIALTRKFYTFAHILFGTNNYALCDYIFRLVPENKFLAAVGTYANTEIIGKVVNAVYRDGTTMLESDLGLMKIYVTAIQKGNIEVVDYFLRQGYFDLNMRFNKKSTFRMALENGQIALVNYLIKECGYNLNDSDTQTVNPSHLGGDSLIYIAKDKYASTFEYLLRLGASPYVRVLHEKEGRMISLLDWCIINGQKKLVKLLSAHDCRLFGSSAISLNNLNKKCPEIESYINQAIADRKERL